jgi:hypothetical protein
VTGALVEPTDAHNPTPHYWHEAITSYVGLAVRFARGPRRGAILRHALQRAATPRVEAAFQSSDPLPGLLFAFAHLRHPRALLRPFLHDVELGPIGAGAIEWEKIAGG